MHAPLGCGIIGSIREPGWAGNATKPSETMNLAPIDSIGFGASADVWLAEDIDLKRKVAVKVSSTNRILVRIASWRSSMPRHLLVYNTQMS